MTTVTEPAWYTARNGERLEFTGGPHAICEDVLAAHPDLRTALSASDDLAERQQRAVADLAAAPAELRAEQEGWLASLLRHDYLPSDSALSRPEHAELPPDPALAHDAHGDPIRLLPAADETALLPLPEDHDDAAQRRAREMFREAGADMAVLDQMTLTREMTQVIPAPDPDDAP